MEEGGCRVKVILCGGCLTAITPIRNEFQVIIRHMKLSWKFIVSY